MIVITMAPKNEIPAHPAKKIIRGNILSSVLIGGANRLVVVEHYGDFLRFAFQVVVEQAAGGATAADPGVGGKNTVFFSCEKVNVASRGGTVERNFIRTAGTGVVVGAGECTAFRYFSVDCRLGFQHVLPILLSIVNLQKPVLPTRPL